MKNKIETNDNFEKLFKWENLTESDSKNNDSDFDKLKKEFSKVRNIIGEERFKKAINNHISNN